MNTRSKLPEIRKEAFTKAREKLGLSAKDLGGMACLSTRQIEQIENGETSSFYGAQVKFTAAKKVAKLLDLNDEEAFDAGVVSPSVPLEPQNLEIPKGVSENKSPAITIKAETPPIKKIAAQEIAPTSEASSAKTASQKKLFLGLSLLAAVIFSIVNLQPLFFSDKPEEVVVIKEELVEPTPAPSEAPVEPVPTPATPASVAAALSMDTQGTCPSEDAIVSYKPEAPRKPADMVYVQSKSKQTVCVVDASGKVQNKIVEPGVGASFYGKPPFKVLTPGLTQVDVFFQGAKVRLANLNTKTLMLEATEVVAPVVSPLIAPATDRTDSQLR